ncbi:MAG TPA: hypothetical protein DCE42_02990 [Myxococcales bacterium]|nr:hypothetical protein [Myxococcales bacterium]
MSQQANNKIEKTTNTPSRNDFGVYSNKSGYSSTKLPPTKKNQMHNKGRVRNNPTRSGAYRVVLLKNDTTNVVMHRYDTKNDDSTSPNKPREKAAPLQNPHVL